MYRREKPNNDPSNELLDVWNCRFDRDFCNMKNDHNLAAFRRHSDETNPIFGESSMVYINVSIAGYFPAARLETDYFSSYSETSACFSITYLMYGTGAKKIHIIQQDVENKCIWVDNNQVVDTNGKWKEAKMTIDLSDGNPRFFIEGHIDVRPPNYGTIAISRLTFSYGNCLYDDTNHCHINHVYHEPPLQPIPSAV
ncbi:uncharacterized protein LOC128966456 [Oppia nitens]|uniref:uncharacterized protein LOC128966456 n=1 Tax=Oppia nitens TaxID=1686743 RepID=UPI0023DCBFA9|nr:uncharacterized protein LOC128966456 [Oppia nitens]